MDVRFDGQVVLVTGAGRGLGREYALELARRGAAVVVNDVGAGMGGDGADAGVTEVVVAEIQRAGGTAVASHDSVDTAEGGAAIVATAIRELGRLDAVVSNAGIFQTVPFEDLDPGDWERMVRVHLGGAFHVSQPAYRQMQAQGSGRFVFIASSAGLFGQPSSAHYAAAKSGIVGLANVIAIEGAAHGIHANTVLPFGRSRMVSETVGDAGDLPGVADFLEAIRPELVVPVVVFLASAACGLTHHVFSACAGRYARVFVGLGPGWVRPDGGDATAEDVVANLEQISATSPFAVPTSIFDEVAEVCGRLGIAL